MTNMTAWIEDKHYILLRRSEGTDAAHEKNAEIVGEGVHIPLSLHDIKDDGSVIYYSASEIPLGKSLVVTHGTGHVPLYAGKIVRSPWFDKMFYDSETPLGALCEPEKTVFRVWSPVAEKISLKLEQNTYTMKRTEKGIWECTVNGDWHGSSYMFQAKVNGEIFEVADPYALGLTANSRSSVAVDMSRTDPEGFSNLVKPVTGHLQDSVIYELHVRDATSHQESGAESKGKYSGLSETGTVTGNGFSTGLDYLADLGITHVQLMPVNDFARVDDLAPSDFYNWGYDPLFYNTPEGSYASDPSDPAARIREMKQLVKALNETGLSVIIDVVYNHVYIMEESPFERLVPGYFFRYDEFGSVSNGTGVGNDLATERKMVRRFILDSIDVWLSHYQADGFRFDLMGAIDIETMKAVSERCSLEGRPVMLLGEGWELPTALPPHLKSVSARSEQLPHVRFFNDFFRDTLKGNLFDFNDYGFVNGKGRYIERLPQLIKGSSMHGEAAGPFVHNVNQTVNYVECHDNHTLWDRLQQGNSHEDAESLKDMHKMATGLMIVSQGVPFLHAGQEWFRSKGGDGNSYMSGDAVNQLNWAQREEEDDHIQYVRKLIHIRKSYDVFRMRTESDIQRRLHILATPAPVFGFTLFDLKGDFCIFANPTKKRYQLVFPSPGTWEILVSNKRKRSAERFIKGELMEAEPYEFLVAKKTRV